MQESELKNKITMKLKRPLKKSEKLLVILLLIALTAVIFKWDKVKEGFVKGWKAFNIEKWYSKE